MDESLQSITAILQKTNFALARKIISEERCSHVGLPINIHYLSKWDDKLHEFDIILHNLGVPSVIIN